MRVAAIRWASLHVQAVGFLAAIVPRRRSLRNPRESLKGNKVNNSRLHRLQQRCLSCFRNCDVKGVQGKSCKPRRAMRRCGSSLISTFREFSKRGIFGPYNSRRPQLFSRAESQPSADTPENLLLSGKEIGAHSALHATLTVQPISVPLGRLKQTSTNPPASANVMRVIVIC